MICALFRFDWTKAGNFYNDGLVQESWEVWVAHVRAHRRAQYIQERKLTRVAESHRRLTLLRAMWRRLSQYRLSLLARARAVHSHCVQHSSRKTAFIAWRVSLERRRREVTHFLEKHRYRSRATVLSSCFRQWRRYLQEQEMEAEIDSRADMAWARVQGWLSS